MSRSVMLCAALLCAMEVTTTARPGDDRIGDDRIVGEVRHPLRLELEGAVPFDGSDPQATAVARQMYGGMFRWVEASRIWLKAPDDGFEQMAVQLSKDRNCDQNCLYAVLFHDDRNWLELWRGRASALHLGPIGPEGLRGIHDGVRLWSWAGGAYRPGLREYRFDYRAMKPQERTSIETALAEMFAAGDAETRYAVLDFPVNDGVGAIVSVTSLTYCGQLVCPVFVLDKTAQIVGRFQSIEGQSGAALERDASGNPMIETLAVNGLVVYRIGDTMPVFTLSAQRPIIAGRERQ